jgi:heme/copper-type cytochrome/quinol oxidase subunit 2
MERRMKETRNALARMQVALIIIVLVVAAGVGVYALSTQGSSSNEVHLKIIETDPVNQVDNFVPQNFTVKEGASVTFVVQNGDDENRVFTIAAFNFNMTILPGTTTRAAFTPDKTGTFTMYSPQTLPSAASHGKPGTPCTGYLTVTA